MAEIPFPCLDPVLLQLGPLQIRWYSLGYVFGFMLGYWILKKLAEANFLRLKPERVGDLLFWLVLAVMLGGRLGYCLFYKPDLLASWRVIAVWEGGLSFHGGLIGVILAAVIFSLRNAMSPRRTLDALALAVTPGIFFVRIANFINGELYGRVTDASVAWAMRFPTDPAAQQLMHINAAGIRDREAAVRTAIDTGVWDKIKAEVPLRHPSQLYEAVGEGLIVGLMLLVVYMATRARPLGKGVYGSLFLLGYGVVRFFIENYRQPDEQFRGPDDPLGTVFLGLTMGQVLCSGMILAALISIAFCWKSRDDAAGVPTDDAA